MDIRRSRTGYIGRLFRVTHLEISAVEGNGYLFSGKEGLDNVKVLLTLRETQLIADFCSTPVIGHPSRDKM